MENIEDDFRKQLNALKCEERILEFELKELRTQMNDIENEINSEMENSNLKLKQKNMSFEIRDKRDQINQIKFKTKKLFYKCPTHHEPSSRCKTCGKFICSDGKFIGSDMFKDFYDFMDHMNSI